MSTNKILFDELSAAVNRSETNDEIVLVDVDNPAEARAMLCTMVDDPIETDWVETGDGINEVWAYSPDSVDGEMVWRVHLRLCEPL